MSDADQSTDDPIEQVRERVPQGARESGCAPTVWVSTRSSRAISPTSTRTPSPSRDSPATRSSRRSRSSSSAAGFAGMLTAINLGRHGIRDVRIVEKASDFGGPGTGNRYRGACATSSPTRTCAVGRDRLHADREVRQRARDLRLLPAHGRHFDLYPLALFQTEIETAEWDEEAQRWRVTTSRGDQLSARFLVTAGGILHKAKLPGIPGIDSFEGKAFPHQPLGLLGHGRRAGRADGPPGRPSGGHHRHRGDRGCRRSPSWHGLPRSSTSSSERPLRWAARQRADRRGVVQEPPAGLARRTPVRNFTQAVTGRKPDVDLVQDGWTKVMWEDTQSRADDAEHAAELERSDFETMRAAPAGRAHHRGSRDRRRSSSPGTASHCKRVCFHDD